MNAVNSFERDLGFIDIFEIFESDKLIIIRTSRRREIFK